jgi:hypothetical protein
MAIKVTTEVDADDKVGAIRALEDLIELLKTDMSEGACQGAGYEFEYRVINKEEK